MTYRQALLTFRTISFLALAKPSAEIANRVDAMADFPQASLLWYGIRVRSKFERVVSMALANKGYEEFLPLYQACRAWSDRSKQIPLPLFPGYTFCRFDVQGRLLPILTTPGVVSIVSAGKVPIPIPNREIDAVKAVVSSGLPALPWPLLSVGSKVVIEKGPLAGIEGITLNVDKGYRLIVSIPLLQRAVSVEIDREWARPVGDVAPRNASALRVAERARGSAA
jgi:transcription antitermination factor NusG